MKYLYVLCKKFITWIPPEHTPFSQLRQLDDFSSNTIVNFFVYERLKIPEVYPNVSRTSKIKLFASLVYS